MKKIAQEEFVVNSFTANQFLDWMSAQVDEPIRDATGQLLNLLVEMPHDMDAILNQPTLRAWDFVKESQSASVSFYDRSEKATGNNLQDLLMTIGIELGTGTDGTAVFGFFIRAILTEELETSAETFVRLLPNVIDVIDQTAREGADLAA